MITEFCQIFTLHENVAVFLILYYHETLWQHRLQYIGKTETWEILTNEVSGTKRVLK